MTLSILARFISLYWHYFGWRLSRDGVVRCVVLLTTSTSPLFSLFTWYLNSIFALYFHFLYQMATYEDVMYIKWENQLSKSPNLLWRRFLSYNLIMVNYYSFYGCDHWGYSDIPDSCTAPSPTGWTAAAFFVSFVAISSLVLITLFVCGRIIGFPFGSITQSSPHLLFHFIFCDCIRWVLILQPAIKKNISWPRRPYFFNLGKRCYN